MYILVVQVQKHTTGIDGFFPIEQENTLEQGYIFNLCVIDNARQRSVGKSLMEAALQVFTDAGKC
jgi:ribosomal protein S18 acetylase RimI-like enzyme